MRQPILTRHFVLAAAAMHLYFIAFFSTYTAIPLALEGDPDWKIGLVVGIFGVPSVFARPLAGRMTDRYGRKGSMMLGAAVTTACFALYGVTTNLLLLVPLRLINGAIMAFFATGNTTLVADGAPPDRRGETMGYFNFVNTSAQVYAPWAGLLLADRAGLHVYWVVVTIVMVVSTGLASLCRETPHEGRRVPGSLICRPALLPFAVFACLTTGYSTFLAFLTPYADEGIGDAGLWFALLGIGMLSARITSGRLADRFGRPAVIVPGAALTAAGLLILGVVQVPVAFYASACVTGIGFAACHTALSALTIDRVSPNERGAAIAQFLMAWDVGQAVGTIPMGLVVGATDFSVAFVLGAGAAALAIPVLRAGRVTDRGRRPAVSPM